MYAGFVHNCAKSLYKELSKIAGEEVRPEFGCYYVLENGVDQKYPALMHPEDANAKVCLYREDIKHPYRDL